MLQSLYRCCSLVSSRIPRFFFLEGFQVLFRPLRFSMAFGTDNHGDPIVVPKLVVILRTFSSLAAFRLETRRFFF